MRTMKKIATAAVAAVTLIGGLATATESSAQGRHYYGGHRDHDGAAVAAGIAGLALGAALAGNSRGGYYYGPSYGYRPAYYGGYYQRPYYSGGYARTCVYWHRDRWGRPFRTTGWC
jgi:hypothetical protein